MNNKDQIHSLLVSIWAIQNSALQSFRGIFITVEAILISVAIVFLTPKANLSSTVVLSILGIFLSALWKRIAQNRGYDDSYLRWQIVMLESGEPVSEKVFTNFRAWQGKSIRQKHRELSSHDLGRQFLPSFTREVFDSYLPVISLGFWIVLAIYYIVVN